MKIKCAKCNKELSFKGGRISLVCQSCGCYDLQFSTDVSAVPVAPTGDLGPKKSVLAGDSFFGIHEHGGIWDLEEISIVRPEPPAETESIIASDQDLPFVIFSPEEEEVPTIQEPEKSTLDKVVKKLRKRIG